MPFVKPLPKCQRYSKIFTITNIFFNNFITERKYWLILYTTKAGRPFGRPRLSVSIVVYT